MKYISITIVAVTLIICATVVDVANLNKRQNGYFAQVPENKIHTMRVYEDGSFNIEYKDGTSERGCLPSGLCQD